MSLQKFLKAKRLVKTKTTAIDIQGLLEMAEQDLADTKSQGLSADGKYVFAYGAALALSAAVVRASGYKTRGQGHHETLFQVLGILLPQEKPSAVEFDRARKKRNKINYERPKQASDKEAEDLLKVVMEFRDRVVDWLKKNHPNLMPAPAPPPRPCSSSHSLGKEIDRADRRIERVRREGEERGCGGEEGGTRGEGGRGRALLA